MKNRYIKIFMISCAVFFLASGVYAAENKDIEAQIKALEKKIQKAEDVEAIKLLMTSMQFHISGRDSSNTTTPSQCFGQNEGYQYGNRMPGQSLSVAISGGNGTQPGQGNMPGNQGAMPDGQSGGQGMSPQTAAEPTAGMTGMMQSNLDFHILTTAVIEVADDGKTAKAVWYSPGILSEGSAPNWMTAWIFELYACDFVKEDGVWKSWHRTLSTDFMTSPSKSWTDSWSAAVSNTDVSRISAILDSTKTGEYDDDVRMRNVQGGGQAGAQGSQDGAPGGQGAPPGGQGGAPPQGGMPEGTGGQAGAGGMGAPPGGQGGPPGGGGGMGEGKDVTGVFYQSWTATTMPQFKPKPPEPYSTFTETFSYCPAMPMDLAEKIYPDQLDELKSLNMLEE